MRRIPAMILSPDPDFVHVNRTVLLTTWTHLLFSVRGLPKLPLLDQSRHGPAQHLDRLWWIRLLETPSGIHPRLNDLMLRITLLDPLLGLARERLTGRGKVEFGLVGVGGLLEEVRRGLVFG